ncbi:MAG: ATP-binding protein [Parvibaculum sp.]
MAALDTEQDKIALDLLRSVMRSFRATPLLYPALSGFIALELPSQFPREIILIWWLATLGLQVEYALYQQRFFKQAQDRAESWTKASAIRYLSMNTLWICMVPLFWQPDNHLQNMALTLIQVVHALLSTVLAAPNRVALFACSLPNFSAAIIGAWWINDPTMTMLSGAFLLTYVFLIRMGSQTRKTLENEYRLNLRNKRLVTDLAIARDISEAARIRSEEANAELIDRKERFRALVDNAFDSVIVTDKEAIITYASPSVRTIGMRPEDLLGRSIFSFLPETEIKKIKETVTLHGDQTPYGEPVEFHLAQRNGKVSWFKASISDLRKNPTVGGYVVNIRDVTDCKRSQTETVNQFRVLEALAKGAPIGKVMELVAKGAEEANPAAHVAIYLVNENLELTVCATPSFPDHFKDAVITFWEKNREGPFGEATKQEDSLVVLPDLLDFVDQPDVIDLSETFGVRAFWMQNFRATDPKGGAGAIAVYLAEPRHPTDWEKSYLKGAAQLASIAVNRRRAEQSLREATQSAELTNRAKSKFLANMSHELRTPLNAIIGFSDIMKSELFGSLGSARYAEYAKDINDSGAHLLNVIDDILDISKIEAGRYPLEENDLALADVLRWSIEIVRPRTTEKQITVILKAAEDLPPVYGDLRAMRQIMLNLLSNAAKFTPPEGKITVAANLDRDGSLIISVADNGIGIPTDKLNAVLEPFGQVDDSSAREHDGTGLGLSITKSLAELHEGEFYLESELGKGTTAIVKLPSNRLRPNATVKMAVNN